MLKIWRASESLKKNAKAEAMVLQFKFKSYHSWLLLLKYNEETIWNVSSTIMLFL